MLLYPPVWPLSLQYPFGVLESYEDQIVNKIVKISNFIAYHVNPFTDNEGSEEFYSLQIANGKDQRKVDDESFGGVTNGRDGDYKVTQG